MSTLSLQGAVLAAFLSLPGLALADIIVTDPYARTSRPNAPTGAAFMLIENTSETADRLVSARSDIARRVEIHSHIDQGDGIMKMVELEDGITIEAGATHALQRGGDHVMLMGLVEPLEQDAMVEITLTFEQAGDVVLRVPVDNERKPKHGHMNHGHSDHGATN